MIDRKVFFDKVRQQPFPNSLAQSQVDGCSVILDEGEHRNLDFRFLAYMLATAYHETAHTMQPIAEYGKGKGRKYGVIGRHGQVAYGRGFVQLTWDDGYEKADKELGLNGALVKNYDLAMQPGIATKIMFDGMLKGWFTGKKLSDFFNAVTTDWVNARKIINGLDRAEMIASYARQFHQALIAANSQSPQPSPNVPPNAQPKASWLDLLLRIFGRK